MFLCVWTPLKTFGSYLFSHSWISSLNNGTFGVFVCFFFALAPSHSISLVLNAILVARTMWANTFNAVQCARCAWKSNCLCTILFADNGKILIWLLPFVFIWYFSAAIFRVPIYNNAECKFTHLSTRFSCAYFGCW